MFMMNNDILRSELGQEVYAVEIEQRVEVITKSMARVIRCGIFQWRNATASTMASFLLAMSVMHGQLSWSNALMAEACTLGCTYIIHRRIQYLRTAHLEQIRRALEDIRLAIPEGHRLIGEAALEECGVDEQMLSEVPESKRMMSSIDSTVRTAIEKVVPWVTALFV